MLSKPRSPVGVASNRGSKSRSPRTVPVTQSDSLDFSSSTMAEIPSHYALTSSCHGSRRPNMVNSDLMSCNNYPGSSGDDFFLSATSSMSFNPITSAATFSGPLLPTMGSFDELDSSPYDPWVASVVSTSSPTEMNFVTLPYHSQGPSQDILSPYVDVSMCGPAVMNPCYGPDAFNWSPIGRPDTPPPEAYIDRILPQQLSPPEDIQDDPCADEQDYHMFEVTEISTSSSHRSDCQRTPVHIVHTDLASSSSLASRQLAQPRPIRSASDRSDLLDENRKSPDSRIAKDDQGDKVKARNHPLYDATPKEDGKFHCPMKDKAGCNHEPTGQRCIYK